MRGAFVLYWEACVVDAIARLPHAWVFFLVGVRDSLILFILNWEETSLLTEWVIFLMHISLAFNIYFVRSESGWLALRLLFLRQDTRFFFVLYRIDAGVEVNVCFDLYLALLQLTKLLPWALVDIFTTWPGHTHSRFVLEALFMGIHRVLRAWSGNVIRLRLLLVVILYSVVVCVTSDWVTWFFGQRIMTVIKTDKLVTIPFICGSQFAKTRWKVIVAWTSRVVRDTIRVNHRMRLQRVFPLLA